MNRGNLIQDLTTRPKINVKPVSGIVTEIVKPLPQNIRPPGFTFNVSLVEVIAAPTNAFSSNLSGVNDVVFPFECQLKTFGIVGYQFSGGVNIVLDPRKFRMVIANGSVPATVNPGFDPIAGYVSALSPGWVDTNSFSLNGDRAYHDLSPLGLVFSKFSYIFFLEAAFIAGDTLRVESTFRFDRITSKILP